MQPHTENTVQIAASALIAALEHLDTRDRVAHAHTACLQHGGSFTIPHPNDPWASHLAELTVHGITGRGADGIEAVTDWIRAAIRVVDPAVTEGSRT